MAVTTTTHTVSGKSVSVTGDGDITVVQTGGPSGALEFRDTAGNVATVKLSGQAAPSVFADYATSKTFADAIATARNAVT